MFTFIIWEEGRKKLTYFFLSALSTCFDKVHTPTAGIRESLCLSPGRFGTRTGEEENYVHPAELGPQNKSLFKTKYYNSFRVFKVI